MLQNNLFSAFELQGIKTGSNQSKFITKQIKGANNTFQNFVVADYSPDNTGNPPSALPNTGGAYAFWIGGNAERTVIENCVTEGIAKDAKDKKAGWYYDEGTGTQFINNANTNRKTDYIKNELDDVVYRGNTKNVSDFTSEFSVNRFKMLQFGNNNFQGVAPALNFDSTTLSDVQGRTTLITYSYLRGNIAIRPQNSVSGMSAQGDARIPNDYVLTSTGGDGSVKWVNPNSIDSPFKTIYNRDSEVIANRKVNILDDFSLEFTSRLSAGNPDSLVPTLTIKNGKTYVGKIDNVLHTYFEGLSSVGDRYNFIVNGKAWVKTEVNVQSTGIAWPDYVFEKSYTLKPLTEVEAYIKKHGRLHNMPSAKEIEENGLPLADISIRQQEKIEELTLYAIEQDKKVTAQQTELETLKANLEEQKQEIETLKKMMNQLLDKKN